LASIEAIPNMVHEAVDCVLIVCHILSQCNWLDGAVRRVCIERFKEKDTKLSVNTVSSVPCTDSFTPRVASSGCGHI